MPRLPVDTCPVGASPRSSLDEAPAVVAAPPRRPGRHPRAAMLAILLLTVVPAACQAQRAAPKALLVGIDGCRPDALVAADTPALDRLASGGFLSTAARTGPRTASGPAWSSLLTGVWPEKHGVVDNSFEGARLEEHPVLFQLLRTRRPALHATVLAQWAPVAENLAAGAESTACASGADVTRRAVEFLQRPEADLLFLHYDDVDRAGHAHGYGPDVPAYQAAIVAVDRQLASVLQAMVDRPAFRWEDWLVIVTTDHGGSGTGHGKDLPELRRIFFLESGRGVAHDPPVPPPVIVDAVPTILAHFGVRVAPRWQLDGRDLGPAGAGRLR